jgi:drug/metabolite transporter (DMT)-like permease
MCTGVNFIGAAMVMTALIPIIGVRLTSAGWMLALASGIVTSALGYVIWYSVLPHLSRIGAATAQLSVPVIAALGGAALLGEAVGIRLVAAGALILVGIGLTLRR